MKETAYPGSSSSRPRLLDLFCGGGGGAVGYHRAGFDVVGVDHVAQPRYPFEFHLADALTYPLEGFDVIHSSPPCQHYSYMSACRPGLAAKYPAIIEPIRERLREAGVTTYVIENVPGSPLIDPVTLCGQMFGLRLYRHRGFESNTSITAPSHPRHVVPASRAGHWTPGTIMSVAGHVAPIAEAREAMGVDWMNRAELGEAIPPAYTEWIGRQLIQQLRG